MIIKITKGVSATGCLAYDYGPGRGQKHVNPRRVNGSVAGRDWRARGRAMQAQLRASGDTREGGPKRVWRLACRAAPADRIMSDREWAEISGKVVDRFTGDAANFSWEVVRHDRDHVHITLLQRGHDGKIFKDRHDYRRAQKIAAEIEHEHDLTRVDHTPVRGDKQRRQTIRQRDNAARERWRSAGRGTGLVADPVSPATREQTRDERLAAARRQAEQWVERQRAQREQGERGGRDR